MGGKKEWLASARGVSEEGFEVRRPVPKGFEDPDKLVISKDKIVKYSLNKGHPDGSPKAVAFEKYLGYTLEKKEAFEAFIRNSISDGEISFVADTPHGSKYKGVSYVTTLQGDQIQLITVWQIDHGATVPRYITAYLKPERKEE